LYNCGGEKGRDGGSDDGVIIGEGSTQTAPVYEEAIVGESGRSEGLTFVEEAQGHEAIVTAERFSYLDESSFLEDAL
jgi:hypothetical protein